MKLLLASKSPRRRQLLSELGFPIEFVDLNVDEHTDNTIPATEIAQFLAHRKAMAYPVGQLKDDEVLVTADTVVVHNNKVLGKPIDREEAIAMLRSLSGDRHTVYTGVCLRSNQQEYSFTEATDVFFTPLSDEVITYYIDNYQPYDKAGAYGIQEWIGMVAVERIEGCYYNVMGLPVAQLYRTLRNRFLSK